LTGAATADHLDAVRPDCANIVSTNVGYQTMNGMPTVTAFVRTVAPSCRGVTYSLNVVVDPDNFFSQVVTTSRRGNGGGDVPDDATLLRLSTQVQDDDSTVCVFVTTSRGGAEGTNQPLDRDPDTGCSVFTLDGGGGVIGHG
jgi:hypothetical protein